VITSQFNLNIDFSDGQYLYDPHAGSNATTISEWAYFIYFWVSTQHICYIKTVIIISLYLLAYKCLESIRNF